MTARPRRGKRSRGRSGLGVVTLWVLLYGGVPGCCTTPPPGEKFFDRARSPEESVRLFRYAIEAKQFDVAYRCLSARFQERHSPTELSLALRFGSWNGIGLRRLVMESEQDERVEGVRGLADAVWVTLIHWDDPEDPASAFQELSLFVTLEGKEWRIDPERLRPDYEAWFRTYSRR